MFLIPLLWFSHSACSASAFEMRHCARGLVEQVEAEARKAGDAAVVATARKEEHNNMFFIIAFMLMNNIIINLCMFMSKINNLWGLRFSRV